MDWQTKEHLDSRLDELEEKIDLLIQHFNIELDSDYEEEQDSEEENTEILN